MTETLTGHLHSALLESTCPTCGEETGLDMGRGPLDDVMDSQHEFECEECGQHWTVYINYTMRVERGIRVTPGEDVDDSLHPVGTSGVCWDSGGLEGGFRVYKLSFKGRRLVGHVNDAPARDAVLRLMQL